MISRNALRACALSIALLALVVPSAVATTSVDPSTLNPPPPDYFNAQCSRTGEHILCTLAFSDPDVVDEPSGLPCDGTELHMSVHRSVTGKRTYSAAGDLLQRHFIETLSGTFTNPESGKIAFWDEHDTILHNLAVPGDLGTGTTHVAGNFTRVWLSDGGTILNDAGMFLADEGAGELIHMSAHHPFEEYFSGADPSALDPICEALE
jgi:hypothetical protein